MVEKVCMKKAPSDPLVVALSHPEIAQRVNPQIAAGLEGRRLVDYSIGVILDTIADLPGNHPSASEVIGLVDAVRESSEYRAYFSSGADHVIERKNSGYRACDGF